MGRFERKGVDKGVQMLFWEVSFAQGGWLHRDFQGPVKWTVRRLCESTKQWVGLGRSFMFMNLQGQIDNMLSRSADPWLG
jgi:hypothetical protein